MAVGESVEKEWLMAAFFDECDDNKELEGVINPIETEDVVNPIVMKVTSDEDELNASQLKENELALVVNPRQMNETQLNGLFPDPEYCGLRMDKDKAVATEGVVNPIMMKVKSDEGELNATPMKENELVVVNPRQLNVTKLNANVDLPFPDREYSGMLDKEKEIEGVVNPIAMMTKNDDTSEYAKQHGWKEVPFFPVDTNGTTKSVEFKAGIHCPMAVGLCERPSAKAKSKTGAKYVQPESDEEQSDDAVGDDLRMDERVAALLQLCYGGMATGEQNEWYTDPKNESAVNALLKVNATAIQEWLSQRKQSSLAISLDDG